MDSLLKDIRYAVRGLVRRPGFTAVVVITLALGIGANAAVFSVINAVLLRPLPYRDVDRVVTLWQNNSKSSIPRNDVAPANFVDWSEQNKSFEAMAGIEPFGFSLIGDGEPERLAAWLVTSGFFDVAEVRPIHGRTFVAEDFTPGNEKVVLLSYALWQRRFGGDASVVGRKLTLNGQPHVVVGVMPPEFQLPPDRDVWAPKLIGERQRQLRAATYWNVVAKLKPGVTLSQAREEMNGIAARLATQYPDTNGGMGVTLVPLYEQLTGQVQSALWVLGAAVAFVLLIACANVANLLLVRAIERQREFAVRTALGAARFRLFRQTLTESLLLVLAGSVLGVLIASWGVKLIPTLGNAKIPRLEFVAVDSRVLLFTVALSLLTTVAFGVVPAIQFWRSDIRSTLQSARGSTGPARQRVRQALVIGEVAIALVLLMGAGLLFRSFVRLLSVDPGFAKERVLALQVFLRNNFEKPDQFFDQSLQKIAAVPGVESAAVVSSPPFINFETDTTFNIVGRPAPPSGSEPTAFYSQVSSDYLKTLGVPLKRGRFLTSFDRAETRPVVVINEAMARRYFANEEPVGKQLSVMYGEPVTCEIVGVVGNVLHSGLHAEPRPEMFVPHQQSPSTQMTFLVKTAPDAETMLPAVKQAIREVNNTQTFAKTATMEELVADSLKQRRFNLFLLGLFAAIALLLATVGIYGSISYMARQRTNEIGVRIALGAQSRDVLKLIVGQGLGLAVAGVVIGLLCAFLLTRTISGLLFGVGPMDPLTFMVISLLLLATAFVASLIPARRATKVDPLTALRSE